MEISIKPLTPALADEYVRFFDTTPHYENKAEDTCYCVTWRSDCSYENNAPHWFPKREERRERALQFVREGSLRGYLAYHGGEIIGWCNASEHCRLAVQYLRSFWPIEEYDAAVRVKSIFCLMIAPPYKRMGVATRLVERVVSDAAADGFDFVEAYANKTHSELDFTGPVAMYENCGFVPYAERGDRVVKRKTFSKESGVSG